MKFVVSGKNIDVTEALKDRIESKIGKLSKFFNEDTEVHATLSVEKNRQIVEVTIPFKGIIFRTEQYNDDMYAAIDKVVDILERQIVKNKTRLEKRFKEDASRFENLFEKYQDSTEDEYKVVKVKKFAMKPMTQDEAILQMNLLGHEFFVFRSVDDNQINIIYKRRDGNYGMIQPKE